MKVRSAFSEKKMGEKKRKEFREYLSKGHHFDADVHQWYWISNQKKACTSSVPGYPWRDVEKKCLFDVFGIMGYFKIYSDP